MTATREPETIVAGDAVSWIRTAASIPLPSGEPPLASAGWSLSYALVSPSAKISIVAEASGDDHLVSLSAATTAAYPPGRYAWQAYAARGEARYTVAAGELEIRPNFASAPASGLDARSHVRRVLEALEAKLEGRASREQEQMIVGGEVVGMMPIARLLEWRRIYRQALAEEQAASRVAEGLGSGKRILVRFGRD